jgi:hypothetical protein
VLTRDLRNLSQLVTPLLFGLIYAFVLARSGISRDASGAPPAVTTLIRNLAVYGNVAISLFIGWSLLSRLALMSFSQERSSYWLLKTAPVSSGQLLLAKFITAYLPPLVMGSGFLLVVSLLQHASLVTLLFGLALIVFSLAGAVGVNLAFGVAGVNFTWQNPRQMMRGTQGCLASLASMAYMLLIVLLFLGPVVLSGLFQWPDILGRFAGLALGIPVSLVCAILPPRAVIGRIARLGEEA